MLKWSLQLKWQRASLFQIYQKLQHPVNILESQTATGESDGGSEWRKCFPVSRLFLRFFLFVVFTTENPLKAVQGRPTLLHTEINASFIAPSVFLPYAPNRSLERWSRQTGSLIHSPSSYKLLSATQCTCYERAWRGCLMYDTEAL